MENRLIRHQARRMLDTPTAPHGNRLTLILAQLCLLVVAAGVYMIPLGLYQVSGLLFGYVLWLDIAAYGLMGGLALLVWLPLAASVYRLACLMTLARPSLPAGGQSPDLSRLFDPFTSRRAYRRALAVGMEALGWVALVVGVPAVGYGLLAAIFDRMANRGVHTTLCNLMTAASLLLCVVCGLLCLLLSGRRAGFGYFVFTREELSLREVNRYFKGLRREWLRPLALRFSLTGWVLLSVVAVLVPFVVHTIPYALCCSTVYASELEKQ